MNIRQTRLMPLRRTRWLTTWLLLLLLSLLAGCEAGGAAPLPPPVIVTPPVTTLPIATSPLPTATPSPLPTAYAGNRFDGAQAMAYLTAQMALGPRHPGSPGHVQVRGYISDQLAALGWAVEQQTFDYRGFGGMNIIGRANQGADRPVILLGAHYDSRARADQSPGQEHLPVPGAVDGASGVAVLLELARTLDLAAIDAELWLAFFDLEDNGAGGINDWGWIVGSTYMAENLTRRPAAMVLVDMIGDADQQLYYEGNSHPGLSERLWQIAADLGYDAYFIPQLKYTIIDDHLPFAQRGIPAVDIIDFDYPYWHTVEDTADKAGADSMQRVGHVVQTWLEGGDPLNFPGAAE